MAIVLTVFLISSTGINARAQEIERDLSAVEAEVDAIDLSGIGALSDTKALIEQSKQLAGIGIGGVPMLMNKLETEEMPGVKRMIYTEGVYELLAIDRMTVLLDPEYYTAGRPEYEGLKKLIIQSKTAVPEIFTSDGTVEKKLDQLSKYGVLSIPYVNEQIEKGNKEYEAYFEKIGLQKDYREWNRENKYDMKLLGNYTKKL